MNWRRLARKLAVVLFWSVVLAMGAVHVYLGFPYDMQRYRAFFVGRQ